MPANLGSVMRWETCGAWLASRIRPSRRPRYGQRGVFAARPSLQFAGVAGFVWDEPPLDGLATCDAAVINAATAFFGGFDHRRDIRCCVRSPPRIKRARAKHHQCNGQQICDPVGHPTLRPKPCNSADCARALLFCFIASQAHSVLPDGRHRGMGLGPGCRPSKKISVAQLAIRLLV